METAKNEIVVYKKPKNKGKILLGVFLTTVAATVAANIITEIFSSKLKKYYSVDN